MAKIVIDPVTRIEGHLRIEAEVDGNRVADAWSSSTMFRGIEKILRGRDPRDAWVFTQRFCGVCTTVHAIAAIRAVEHALDVRVPPNAELIRNIIMGVQNIHDHVIHFYHLHALDWVDITSALKADPARTSALAAATSAWPLNSATYFKGIQDRLAAFVNTRRLGPFANAWWGHPAYRLAPEMNLMATAHYLEALEWQKDIIRIHAILGSKNPHPQTFLVGGMAITIDPASQTALNAGRLAEIRGLLAKISDFVEKVYIPDLLAIASQYKEWFAIGAGVGDFLCYGDFPSDNSGRAEALWMPRGMIRDRDLSRVHGVEQEKIAEYVDHSWYNSPAGPGAGLHPWDGATVHNYTGPRPPYEYLDTREKYSWVKAPRYEGRPVEVGPLARCLIARAAGHREMKAAVDMVLARLHLQPADLCSTMGRTVARGIETLVLARKLPEWLEALTGNIRGGDCAVHNGEKWDPDTWPAEAKGYGWHEAPRGALGHWIRIRDGKIFNYQAVVPSTWLASPRDAKGQRGPYEAALAGTPLADPKRPLEILRTIHSFDPCIACAVHLFDPERGDGVTVKVL
ncbi:MAG: nickel-dependent hydrogenase large subunit [Geobacteraceae bacterium]|nr:nickel-dependent hydrogenase large subunit [Geobacteraceae bacterium]